MLALSQTAHIAAYLQLSFKISKSADKVWVRQTPSYVRIIDLWPCFDPTFVKAFTIEEKKLSLIWIRSQSQSSSAHLLHTREHSDHFLHQPCVKFKLSWARSLTVYIISAAVAELSSAFQLGDSKRSSFFELEFFWKLTQRSLVENDLTLTSSLPTLQDVFVRTLQESFTIQEN